MGLKILQWNIGTPLFKRRLHNIQKFPYNLFHNRRVAFITQKIKELDPDVLCLQEYLPDELDIEDRYPYYVKVKVEHYPVLYTAIFSKKKFDASYIDPKGAFVSINIDSIRLVTPHLYTHDSDARLIQLHRILDLIKKSEHSCICTGDFNYFQMFGKYLFANDEKGHELFLKGATYMGKNSIGSYVLPFELDRLYYTGDLDISQKTSTLYSQFPGLDHFPTLISVDTINP